MLFISNLENLIGDPVIADNLQKNVNQVFETINAIFEQIKKQNETNQSISSVLKSNCNNFQNESKKNNEKNHNLCFFENSNEVDFERIKKEQKQSHTKPFSLINDGEINIFSSNNKVHPVALGRSSKIENKRNSYFNPMYKATEKLFDEPNLYDYIEEKTIFTNKRYLTEIESIYEEYYPDFLTYLGINKSKLSKNCNKLENVETIESFFSTFEKNEKPSENQIKLVQIKQTYNSEKMAFISQKTNFIHF